jgi:hypothetical protein
MLQMFGSRQYIGYDQWVIRPETSLLYQGCSGDTSSLTEYSTVRVIATVFGYIRIAPESVPYPREDENRGAALPDSAQHPIQTHYIACDQPKKIY